MANVTLPLQIQGRSKAESKTIALEHLERSTKSRVTGSMSNCSSCGSVSAAQWCLSRTRLPSRTGCA